MIIDYKDYISSNNILINNDENIIEDDDLLDIYNTENYLNSIIIFFKSSGFIFRTSGFRSPQLEILAFLSASPMKFAP